MAVEVCYSLQTIGVQDLFTYLLNEIGGEYKMYRFYIIIIIIIVQLTGK